MCGAEGGERAGKFKARCLELTTAYGLALQGLGSGTINANLPLLPTTPFVLLAAASVLLLVVSLIFAVAYMLRIGKQR